jgi:DNA-binding CsgD family transcriptional regulator
MVFHSSSIPRSLGAATEAAINARGQPSRLKRVVERSPVPLAIVDNERWYKEVNTPARLVFRLSLAELRRLRIDDLTPRHMWQPIEEAWARLMRTGCVVGAYEVVSPDGGHLDVVYCGLANALPGLHLFAFAPAAWPECELLGALQTSGSGPVPSLTPRQLEVLELAADGRAGRMIAEELVISPATVKTHFENIHTKLGVRDRAAAVAKAMRLGLIT